jgi:hypothetical protein
MHESNGATQESVILSTHVQLAPSTVQLWHKKLFDGSMAVALVNFGVFDGQHYNATFTSDMVCCIPSVNMSYEWIPAILSSISVVRQVGMAPKTPFKARDLFAKVDLGNHPTGTFQALLDATSILMLKLTPL